MSVELEVELALDMSASWIDAGIRERARSSGLWLRGCIVVISRGESCYKKESCSVKLLPYANSSQVPYSVATTDIRVNHSRQITSVGGVGGAGCMVDDSSLLTSSNVRSSLPLIGEKLPCRGGFYLALDPYRRN